MFFHALTFGGPKGDVKNQGWSPRFHHLLRDLANVNAFKNNV